MLTDTVVARGMGARRSLISAFGVPLIAVVLAVALFLPTFNYSYNSPKTFTYHLAIQRGTNTTLTITNSTILLTIAYNESYGSVSGTLMNDFFVASKERVYVSFMPTFCEVKEVSVPLGIIGASHPFLLPPPPPPPSPPPVQKPAGLINLTISFVPVTPTSGPVNVMVQILPCTPFFTTNSSATLLPGYYNVTVHFVWVLTGEFFGLNGTLNISVAHINVITPLPGSS